MALPFYAQKYPTASVGYTKYGGIIKWHESLDFSNNTQLSAGLKICDMRFISQYLRVNPSLWIGPFHFFKPALFGPLVWHSIQKCDPVAYIYLVSAIISSISEVWIISIYMHRRNPLIID
jgi:lipid-A-disaccharide synthase-like uncharacterized protein